MRKAIIVILLLFPLAIFGGTAKIILVGTLDDHSTPVGNYNVSVTLNGTKIASGAISSYYHGSPSGGPFTSWYRDTIAFDQSILNADSNKLNIALTGVTGGTTPDWIGFDSIYIEGANFTFGINQNGIANYAPTGITVVYNNGSVTIPFSCATPSKIVFVGAFDDVYDRDITKYIMSVSLNGRQVYSGNPPFQHGAPYGAKFTNMKRLTIPFDPALMGVDKNALTVTLAESNGNSWVCWDSVYISYGYTIAIDSKKFPSSYAPTGVDLIHTTETGTVDFTMPVASWAVDPDGRDTVVIPGIIYNILYDPPGDQSTASLLTSSSNESSLKIGFSVGQSTTISAGYETELSLPFIGKFGASVEVSQSVSWTTKSDGTITSKVTESSELRSSNNTDDAAYIGPGNGDLFVLQKTALECQLFRRVKPTANLKAVLNDSDYVYVLSYRVIPNSSMPDLTGSLVRMTAGQARAVYRDNPLFLDSLFSKSVIDPATGRVKASCKADTSRLKLVESLDSWSLGGQSQEHEDEVSNGYSMSFDLSSETKLSSKLTAGGASVGAELALTINFNTEKSATATKTRKYGYSFDDDDKLDNFKGKVYVDKRFGVYVFDIDSAQSYSSWPWEYRYTSPLYDWQVTIADQGLKDNAGSFINVPVIVKNISAAHTTDPLVATLNIIDYPYQTGIVNPSEIQIKRNEQDTIFIPVSAPKAGTYRGIVRVNLTTSGATGSESVNDTFTVAFDSIQHGVYVDGRNQFWVQSDTTGMLSHEFTLKVSNVGAQNENLQFGFGSVSAGATPTALSQIANPVARDSAQSVSIRLSGDAAKLPIWADAWFQIEGDPDSRTTIRLIIDSVSKPRIDIASQRYGDTIICGKPFTLSWTNMTKDSLFAVYYKGASDTSWMLVRDRVAADSFICSIPYSAGKPVISIKVVSCMDESVFDVVNGLIAVLQTRVYPAEKNQKTKHDLIVRFAKGNGSSVRLLTADCRDQICLISDLSGRCVAKVGLRNNCAEWNIGPGSGLIFKHRMYIFTWMDGNALKSKPFFVIK